MDDERHSAPLQGRRSQLRPIFSADYEGLRIAELSTPNYLGWRFHGETPSPESYPNHLWAGVLAQYLVDDISARETVGLITCYDANQTHRHASIGVLSFTPGKPSLVVSEAVVLFIEMIFSTWNFRKLYFDTNSLALENFSIAASRLLSQEGRLVGHFEFGGRLVDRVILALMRESWAHHSSSLLRFALEQQHPYLLGKASS